jgi:hypothetical protein
LESGHGSRGTTNIAPSTTITSTATDMPPQYQSVPTREARIASGLSGTSSRAGDATGV